MKKHPFSDPNANGRKMKTGLDALNAFMASSGDELQVQECRAFLADHPEYAAELRQDLLYCGYHERIV